MNSINIDRLMKELSDILSEKHGARITIRAVPKEKYEHETSKTA